MEKALGNFPLTETPKSLCPKALPSSAGPWCLDSAHYNIRPTHTSSATWEPSQLLLTPLEHSSRAGPHLASSSIFFLNVSNQKSFALPLLNSFSHFLQPQQFPIGMGQDPFFSSCQVTWVYHWHPQTLQAGTDGWGQIILCLRTVQSSSNQPRSKSPPMLQVDKFKFNCG